MSERPILFCDEMVRAILTCAKCGKISVKFPCEHCGSEEFRKRQTRRVVNEKLWQVCDESARVNGKVCLSMMDYDITCPHGQVGDLLWMKETWAVGKFADIYKPRELDPLTWLKDNGGCWYKADLIEPIMPISKRGKWRSSMFMPKWSARIWLEITGNRIERVQEITEEDAKAEGVETLKIECWQESTKRFLNESEMSSIEKYYYLWNKLNAKHGHGWKINDWVWVIEFKIINHKSEMDEQNMDGGYFLQEAKNGAVKHLNSRTGENAKLRSTAQLVNFQEKSRQ